MSSAPSRRRAVAEIDFSGSEFSAYKIGNRSIHGFWHLFSAHFRNVLVAPQRRPDTGRVAWTWHEAADNRPATATELAEVRRRLSEARGLMAGSHGPADGDEAGSGSAAATLEGQVISIVNAMVGRLVAERDFALARFVCRTETGLMVHSWGSPVAAVPHFPDLQGGEVSGIVCAISGRPMAARVVLIDKKGAQVAAFDCRSDGLFKFAEVASGAYRLRVTGQIDFPEEGIPVLVEQSPVTGLELRAKGSTTLPRKKVKTGSHGAAAWYRRPVPVALLAVGLLGAGTAAWFYSHASKDKEGPGNQSSVWQVAKGPLVGGAGHDKDASHGALHSGFGWPSLSRLAKALGASFAHETPNASPVAAPHLKAAPLEAARELSRSDEGPQGEGPSPSSSGPTGRSEEPGREATARRSAGAHESDARIAERRAGDSRTAEAGAQGKAAESSDPSTAPEPSRPGAQGAEVETSPARATSSASTVAVRKMRVEVAASAAGQLDTAASALGSVGGTADPGAGGADAGGDGSAAVASAAAGGSSKGQAPAAKGAAGQGPTEGAPAGSGASTPADASEVVVAQEVAEKSNPRKAGPTSVASAKVPDAKPGSAGAPPGEIAADGQAEVAPSDTVPQDRETKARAVTPRAEGSLARVAQTKAAPVAKVAVDTNDDSTGTDSSGGASDTSRSDGESARGAFHAQAATPKPANAPLAQGSGGEQAAGGASESPGGATAGPSLAKEAVKLVRVGRLHASSWKAQVVQDIILPTRPMPVTQGESVEEMREGLKKERLALMPPSFRRPQVRSGFSFEFPAASATGKAAPGWREATGTVFSAIVQGNRAELIMPAAGSAEAHTFVLAYPDGREIAQVTVGPDGTPALNAAPGIRSWYWVGVEHPKSEGVFDWRLASGGSAPESWTRDEHWLDGGGQRIDIPLEQSVPGANRYSIALVDPSTGCGITCAVALE